MAGKYPALALPPHCYMVHQPRLLFCQPSMLKSQRAKVTQVTAGNLEPTQIAFA